MDKKIGLLGGTFNPIHIGHLLLGLSAKEYFNLDEIWLLPTGYSYLKAGKVEASASERYEMCQLAIEGLENFKCCDVEINREGPSYTYETLLELNANYPNNKFYFIIGSDSLFMLDNWKNPDIILKESEIIAAVRGNENQEKVKEQIEFLREKYHQEIHLLPFMNLEISSSELRSRIENKQTVKYLIPDKVLDYIEDKGFYKKGNLI